MLKDEMVKIDHTEKIEVYLKNLVRRKNNILLWQNVDNIRRVRSRVRLKRVDLKNGEIIFVPQQGIFSFDSKLPVYFYAKLRTGLFKNMIFFNSVHRIVVKLPDMLLLKNMRQIPRDIVQDEMADILMKANNFNRMPRFRAILIDRSPNGFAFKSSYGNVVKFKVGDQLEFKFSGMADFLNAMVVGVIEMSTSEGKYFRISVKRV